MDLAEIGLKGETKEQQGGGQYEYFQQTESRINEEDVQINNSRKSVEKIVFQCHFGERCSHRLEYTKPSDQNGIYIGKDYLMSHFAITIILYSLYF